MKNKNVIMGITGIVMAIIWSFCFIKVLNSLAGIIIGICLGISFGISFGLIFARKDKNK